MKQYKDGPQHPTTGEANNHECIYPWCDGRSCQDCIDASLDKAGDHDND